jgi:hypothetical protein
MANEHSGILDANALFGDLPGFMAAPPASSIPPSLPSSMGPMHGAYADVVITSAPPPTHRRRQETTARAHRAADPMRARLIAIITCGSVALVAALGACFLYASTPLTPTPPVAQQGTPAMHAAR